MIHLKDVSLSYGEKELFKNLNWSIAPGSRIGLIGDNGTGKTTLLKLLNGDLEPDSGFIVTDRKNLSFGYLPQDLIDLEDVDLLSFLRRSCGIEALEEAMRRFEWEISQGEGPASLTEALLKGYDEALNRYNSLEGYAFAARAGQILKGLGFKEEDLARNCAEFSGGWKMRIRLALLLLKKPDILLLDEPTNHLDTESMEWLEAYLKDHRGTIIAVSHDRFFLQRLAREIGDLGGEGRGLTIYKGRYLAYLKEKERIKEALKKRRLAQKAEIKRIEGFIERFRYKATKAKQVQSRIGMLEKIDLVPEVESEKTVAIRFPEYPASGKEVLVAADLGKNYGGHLVLRGIDLTVSRGDKIALVGINGAGKSTLLRLISGVEEPSSGFIRLGLRVKTAYFSQESAGNLCYRNTIRLEVQNTPSTFNDQEKRNLLGAFLFSGEDIDKEIAVLSGGEKSRLALLKILLTDANLLILDEPTNHLDLKTKDLFQEALLKYRGTVIVVSHDRYFLDHLINRVIELKEGKIREYRGNYSYFIEKRAEEERAFSGMPLKNGSETDKLTPGDKGQRRENKRSEAEERNRHYRLISGLKRDLAGLEAAIGAREEIKSRNAELLSDPATHKSPLEAKKLTLELKTVEAELPGLYGRWEEMALAIDNLKRETNR